MTNFEIAQQLRQVAATLDRGTGNLFRVRAFRTAAFEIERMNDSVAELFRSAGRAALEALPGVGKSVAYTVAALLTSGAARTLDPAVPGADRSLRTLPGVGPRLAERLQDDLGIHTIDQLAQAAESGCLARVGVGKKRLTGILAAARQRATERGRPITDEPSVAQLLAIDASFRALSQDGAGPSLLVPDPSPWHLTPSYANTAVAHRLGRIGDWVTIEFSVDGSLRQRTVVTETIGPLAGRRVVRGREAECERYYASAAPTRGCDPAA